MKQINWGILGCGEVTEKKSGPAFNKVEGSCILAVMRRNAEKARDYAMRHKVPKWYASADELLENEDINAVYVATPPSSHAEYAIKAMQSGKAVYVEKPMASDYAECEQMYAVSRKTGMPLYVAYYRRSLPYFQKVKDILSSGVLGKMLFVKVDFITPPRAEDYNISNLPWRVRPEIAGGGYFYDMACHQFDLFDWYFGKVSDVFGISLNRSGLYDAEDYVHALIQYESDLPLSGNWLFTGSEQHQTDIIKVFGSEGTLEFSTFEFSPILLTTASGEESFLPSNPENIQFWFIKSMVAELRGIKPPEVNTVSAMRSNYLMDKILGKIAP